MINYSLILTTIFKGKEYICNGYDYNDILWLDSSPKPSQEELDSQWEEVQSIIAKNNCKSKAQTLLNESDFTDLYSVRNKLENINEWDTYRDIIRDLRINPIENPIFPDKPKTIWQEIIPIPIEEPIQEEIVTPTDEPIVNEESAI